MAPIVQAEAASSPFWEFINKHKVALTAAGVLAAGTAGYIIYNAQQSSGASSSDSGSEKPLSATAKKNKKRRNKKKQTGKEKDEKSVETFPTNDEGLPAITEDFLESLSDDEKDKVSVSLKEQGNIHFKAKDFEKALAFYGASLQVKKDPVFYSNRAACYAALKNYEKVIEDTTAALELKRDYGKCLLRRASAYEELKNYPDAMFDLTKLTIYGGYDHSHIEPILERNLRKHSEALVTDELKSKVPTLPSASSISAFLGAFAPETIIDTIDKEKVEPASADDYLLKAFEKLDESTVDGYDLADSYFNQAVSTYGDITSDNENAKKLAVALEYSACFKFLKNESTDALVDLDRALSLSQRSRIYIFKALISADKGGFEEAIKYFDLAISQDPKAADAYYHKAQMYYLINDMDKAEANFNKAKENNPDNVYPFIQLACISYRKGDIGESEKKFAEAKKHFPTSAEVPNYHGEILADQSKFQEAIEEFEIAIRLQEAAGKITIGVVPIVNKASVLSRLGQPEFENAAELLQKACDQDPKSELARISLAQIRLQQEKVEDAIKLFEEASKLARTAEEKIQATSYAEAAKMQSRVKNDPELSEKVREMMARYGIST